MTFIQILIEYIHACFDLTLFLPLSWSLPLSLSLSLLFAHSLGRDETEVVVKVFAKHDPSLKLDVHEKRLYGN